MKNQLLVDWLLGLAHKLSPTYITYSWLIHTTIYVTITALFIILFKQIFKNRLRAKWHFLIWAVLLIRFIVPVLPASPVSVFNTVKVDENVIEQSSYQSIVTTPDNESVDPDDENQYTVAQGLQKMIEAEQNIGNHKSETTSGYTIQIDAIVTYVWLGGTVILLGYFITVLAIYRHRLKKSRRECDETALLDKYRNTLNIKRNVRLYYADTTPMLIGLFKPSIYVPYGLSEAELGATLLHELNHLKFFDILWSAIATIVLCLNWFNPIIWISFFMFKRDLEVYCDERTLMHTENKQSYAMLLLKTATARKEKFVLGTTSLQSGKADVKRRIRYMAKYKKLKAVGTVLAVVLVSTLLMGCLTNAGVFTKKTSTIENPANGCKMDIVLDKSFAGDDYLTGEGTFFEFHTDKPIEEIATRFISDNPDFGIIYQADQQALLIQDNPYSQDYFPYLLLTKKISDKSGKDVENIVFLEAVGANQYIPSYQDSLTMAGNNASEKKFSYYFPEHLRADYRYTNYKDHSYEVDQSNPFEQEIELIHHNGNFNQLINFYQHIPVYRNPDLETKAYDNGDGEILINNPSGQPVFKIIYNAERNTVKYAPYAAFAAKSASSVIYRLENAIQRQDRKLMESCFENFTNDDYQSLSSIKPDFRVENIFPDNIDNVNFKYSFSVHAMIDYNNGMGYNKHNKRFTVEYIGEEPKITYTQLSSFNESANTDERNQSTVNQTRFINEKLGEPDLSDYYKTTFSKPPDILFADNSKAIIGGDCGIIVYSFEKNQITLYASYDYLRNLGLSIPFGNASSDGRIVYINDGAQSFAGVEQANDNYLHLVLDTQEKTIMENSGYYSSDTVERYSVYDLDDDTKEEYGMNEYSNGSYVVNNDTIVYAQLKPNWEPENLSIVRYDKSDHKMEEFKVYTKFPEYSANGKRDMSFLGRFTFDMLIKQIGFHRVLTTVARGYMFESETPDIDRAKGALQAWCSLPTEKKDDWKANTNFSEFYAEFSDLVDKEGRGWFYLHVHNICDFVKNKPGSVSKTTVSKCELLRKGFDKEWEKKVIQFQVPIFSNTTIASWILRFDDILADALELGKLQNKDFSLSDSISEYIKTHVSLSAQPAAELLVKYYIANKPLDNNKVVLLVTNFDAYFGNGTFSKKWLPKELDSVIVRDPQSNGVSRYTLHENLIKLI